MRLTCPHVPIATIFFFNDTATTEIYTLSLHDALPISAHRPAVLLRRLGRPRPRLPRHREADRSGPGQAVRPAEQLDRKSTRLNSSHSQISYAVFCLKKKKKTYSHTSQFWSEAERVRTA